MKGDPVFMNRSGLLPIIDLPSCFKFTKRHKTRVLKQFLGPQDSSKVRSSSDLTNLMSERI
jgi:hypothetical protein